MKAFEKLRTTWQHERGCKTLQTLKFKTPHIIYIIRPKWPIQKHTQILRLTIKSCNYRIVFTFVLSIAVNFSTKWGRHINFLNAICAIRESGLLNVAIELGYWHLSKNKCWWFLSWHKQKKSFSYKNSLALRC